MDKINNNYSLEVVLESESCQEDFFNSINNVINLLIEECLNNSIEAKIGDSKAKNAFYIKTGDKIKICNIERLSKLNFTIENIVNSIINTIKLQISILIFSSQLITRL